MSLALPFQRPILPNFFRVAGNGLMRHVASTADIQELLHQKALATSRHSGDAG
jgi:hypothetical protein